MNQENKGVKSNEEKGKYNNFIIYWEKAMKMTGAESCNKADRVLIKLRLEDIYKNSVVKYSTKIKSFIISQKIKQKTNTHYPTTDSNWEKEFIEKGADLEHKRWAKWQKYMHSKILPSAHDKIMEIGTELINHWNRQINTQYSELTEKEKDSDREEVRQYLPLIRNLIQSERELEREKTIKMLSDMKPILYHEDKNRHLENVAVYNFIDKVIKII